MMPDWRPAHLELRPVLGRSSPCLPLPYSDLRRQIPPFGDLLQYMCDMSGESLCAGIPALKIPAASVQNPVFGRWETPIKVDESWYETKLYHGARSMT